MPIKQCTSELPLYWSSKSLLTDGTLLLCDVSTQNTTVLSITQHHQTILQCRKNSLTCISVHATSITTLTVDLMGPLFHSRSNLVQATQFFSCAEHSWIAGQDFQRLDALHEAKREHHTAKGVFLSQFTENILPHTGSNQTKQIYRDQLNSWLHSHDTCVTLAVSTKLHACTMLIGWGLMVLLTQISITPVSL